MQGPDDIIFGPDGSWYWTEFAFGDVAKRTPDGTITVIASPGPGVNPITFSDDGRLFVSQCALGDHLFELDPDGGDERRLITDQLGPGCGLNGMDWGPDDRLYGPRPSASEVARVDVDRGTFETVSSEFDRPVALKFDSQHRLHVLDSGTGELFRVDIATGERELVGRTGAGSDNLAFDADDRLFVSSYAHSFVVEVLGPETNRTVIAGGVSFPGGVAWLPATDGGGRLFLADRRALRELDPETGAEVHTVTGVGSDLGEALSAHPLGEQLLLSGATSVSIWDPDEDRLVSRFEGFAEAVDAVPLDGDIVVSEYETGSVVRFDPAAPDARTVLASGLEAPAGLAVHGGDPVRRGPARDAAAGARRRRAPRPAAPGGRRSGRPRGRRRRRGRDAVRRRAGRGPRDASRSGDRHGDADCRRPHPRQPGAEEHRGVDIGRVPVRHRGGRRQPLRVELRRESRVPHQPVGMQSAVRE